MDRKQTQLHLMSKVGAVLLPLERVIANPAAYSEEDRRHIRAEFLPEHNRLSNELSTFCRPGDADYYVEWSVADNVWGHIRSLITPKEFVENPSLVGQSLPPRKQEMLDAIAAIPVRVAAVNCEAGTPFTAYCRIRKLFGTTRQKLVYVDRYVDDSMLYLYFEGIPAHVDVTVVTWAAASRHGGMSAYKQFMAASKLYAIQRPHTYTLLESATIHARRLLCDGQLYKLDDSLKSAAMGTAFQLLRDPSSMQDLSNEVAGAKELFGRTATQHP